MDWSVIGPLLGALTGVVGTTIYNILKHRSEIYHKLRVAQFEAVKELAIEINTQVLFEANGNPIVNGNDATAMGERIDEGLPKVAPLVALTEYSLIDREVLMKWKHLNHLVGGLMARKRLKGQGDGIKVFRAKPLPETRFETWVSLSFALEDLITSARNTVLPPRSSARYVRNKISLRYELRGPEGRVANFFWKLRGRATVAGKRIAAKWRKRKSAKTEAGT